MALKLNINRTQIINVPVPDMGEFSVEMQILKNGQEDKKVTDLIVGVKGLEIEDENGRILNESDTIEVIKNDHQLSQFVSNAWMLGNAQTVAKQKTLLEQSAT